MKRVGGLLLVLPLLIGCGKGDVQRNIDVEQEKLTLDLMKAQREQLATLTEKEKAVLEKESKNEEILREVERRQAEIQKSSKALEDQQAAFKNDLARGESELQNKYEALRVEQDQIKKSRSEIEANRREVAEKFAAFQRAKDAENEARAKERNEAEAKVQLVFKAELAEAMSDFNAVNRRMPNSQQEFMTEIVRLRHVRLPELPSGDQYVYDPATGTLLVGHAK